MFLKPERYLKSTYRTSWSKFGKWLSNRLIKILLEFVGFGDLWATTWPNTELAQIWRNPFYQSVEKSFNRLNITVQFDLLISVCWVCKNWKDWIKAELNSTLLESAPLFSMMRNWAKDFKRGCTSTKYECRSGSRKTTRYFSVYDWKSPLYPIGWPL